MQGTTVCLLFFQQSAVRIAVGQGIAGFVAKTGKLKYILCKHIVV